MSSRLHKALTTDSDAKPSVPLRALRRAASLALAGYYQMKNLVSRSSILGASDVDVSITSFGDRLVTVALAIESIGAGKVKPRGVFLWLSEDEVASGKELPRSLIRLQSRGLNILYCSDYRSYKKLIPYVQTQPLERPVVTADDDVFYPRNWLGELMDATDEGTVVCYRARNIELHESGMVNYGSWGLTRTNVASSRVFPTGVSGICYPVRYLVALRESGMGFMRAAPHADDIWFHWVAIRSRLVARQVAGTPRIFFDVPRSQRQSLTSVNVAGGGNDEQFAAVWTDGELVRLRRCIRRSEQGA